MELKGHDAAAELKTWVGTAHMNLDALGPAEVAVASALQRVPDLLPALVLRARLKLVRGDPAAAQTLLDDVLVRYPQSATAWLLQGDALGRGGPEQEAAALEAYRKALAIRPDLVAAHAGVLSLLIGQRDFDGAAKQWAVLKSVQPLQPQTFFFEGVLALQQEKFWRAREVSHMLLRFEPRNPRLLLLAGQAEMRLNSMAQAETLLRKATLEAPDASPPRRVLAEVYLRMGQADKAMNTLEPLLRAIQPDGEVMALVGQAQLMRGDTLAAEISFGRAAKLKPEDKRIRTSAALARLTRGQGDADFSELEAIAKSDTGTMADMALVSTRLSAAISMPRSRRWTGWPPRNPIWPWPTTCVAASRFNATTGRPRARPSRPRWRRNPATLRPLPAWPRWMSSMARAMQPRPASTPCSSSTPTTRRPAWLWPNWRPGAAPAAPK